ncbi:MAG: redoxin domain-containing protein, partial [Bacteroidales bacterium]|nr:redoxin domain-containing protein [Bacteroidales bacterium]
MKYAIEGLIFLSISLLSCAQKPDFYEITVKADNLQDSVIYLGYHFGDKQYIKDTLTLDASGYGVFSGNEKLPQGIYLLVLPGKKYFEILMGEDQVFSISFSWNDYFNTLKFKGSEENNAFIEYQKKWVSMQEKAGSIVKRIQINKQNSDSVRILTAAQKKQEEEMKAYLRKVIADNRNNLLSTLVKAVLPIEVPEFKIPDGADNPDSLKWVLSYTYHKDHFFDNIDLTDERYLRTPLLFARLDNFFRNVVIQSPDSINKEIDRLISKYSSNYKVFQYVAVYLYNHFRESEIMGHDAVFLKIADDIYLSGKADWVSEDFRNDLRKQTDLIRPNLIGNKAHDLVMNSYKGVYVSLYDIEKEFTILYFWEPDCGHCKEATPKLKAYYDKSGNENLEVFAVCTTGDKAKWSKYIEDNNLNWINGWDPERRTRFDFYYNVQSTPLIYILDRNKTIIAKK